MAGPPNPATPLRVRFADFELDEANALLLRNGQGIPLSPTPFGLLCALVRHAGSLLTKHTLLDEVWGHRFVSDSVLKGTISDIRAVLGDDPRSPRFIETVPRRGYRFIGTAISTEAVAPPARSELRSAAPQLEPTETVLASTANALEGAQGTAFIGRAAMLQRLRRAWARAVDGVRSIVWIAGEPGVGKTALVEHFAAGLDERAYVRGQCVQQYGSGEPYLPVLEAIAELCRRNSDAPSLLRAVAPTWLLQLPWVGTAEEREALRREVAGVSPERMLREMAEFLDRHTEGHPLLLVTEDLHWADRSTLQLLDFLARRRSRGRLMWLATFRLAEVIATDHPLNALRHELLLHRLCEEIVLDSFSEAEVAQYLAEQWPSIAVDERLAQALHDRTEGVPLFIASIASDIADRSMTSGLSPAELLESTPIPENLLAIIEHYSNQLSDKRRSLLSAAAVCGTEFRVSVVAKVLERESADVAATCERLARERLWLATPHPPTREGPDDERCAFRHALFRQVIYDRMGSAMRVALHRKVGTVLERDRADGASVSAAQLATHFDLGQSPLQALCYYAEAAETALMQLSPGACLGLTERALSLVSRAPVNGERTSLEITLAALRGLAAFHLLGAGAEAREAYVRADSLLANEPSHALRGLIVHGLGQLLNLRGEFSEALAAADRANALAGDTNDPLLEIAASTTRGQAYMLQGRPRAAREALEQSLPAIDSANAIAEERFIADPRIALLALLSLQLTHLGLVDQARQRLDQAYKLLEQRAQPVSLLVTIWCDALVQVRLGDTDRVAAVAEQMSAVVEKFAIAQGRTAARWFRALASARGGEAAAGYRQIRAAYEDNVALGMIAGGSEVLGYAAEALFLEGDLDGASRQLDEAFTIAERYGERIYLPQLLLTQAAIAERRGERAVAHASMRRALEESRAQEAPWLELLVLTELCEHSKPAIEHRRALDALVAELGEGSDTPAYLRARAVLDRMRR